MKINAPVQEIPRTRGSRFERGKYVRIYAAVDRLKGENWLPVKFDTATEAYNFRVAVATHRNRVMEAVLRGDTVYVRNKTNGTSTRPARGRERG